MKEVTVYDEELHTIISVILKLIQKLNYPKEIDDSELAMLCELQRKLELIMEE